MREGSPEVGARGSAGGRTPGSRASRGGSGAAAGMCAVTPSACQTPVSGGTAGCALAGWCGTSALGRGGPL